MQTVKATVRIWQPIFTQVSLWRVGPCLSKNIRAGQESTASNVHISPNTSRSCISFHCLTYGCQCQRTSVDQRQMKKVITIPGTVSLSTMAAHKPARLFAAAPKKNLMISPRHLLTSSSTEGRYFAHIFKLLFISHQGLPQSSTSKASVITQAFVGKPFWKCSFLSGKPISTMGRVPRLIQNGHHGTLASIPNTSLRERTCSLKTIIEPEISTCCATHHLFPKRKTIPPPLAIPCHQLKSIFR
jgi:hypothetical protein